MPRSPIGPKAMTPMRRQLLWPVNDNYFGRLPLSLTAFPRDPERG
ncbi:hypothetical protein J2T57_002169, partial [Natronocella acetinitrilica]|nr:hypothetical protein [Natronocella acetinitrilica]